MDQLAKGIVRVAEEVSSLFLGQAVDKDSPESFVLTLRGIGGFLEEALAGGVVHSRESECRARKCEVVFGNQSAAQDTLSADE
jgi:hypothetical protein